jgi:hypothetical protein
VAVAPATDGGGDTAAKPIHICEQNLNTASGIRPKRPQIASHAPGPNFSEPCKPRKPLFAYMKRLT